MNERAFKGGRDPEVLIIFKGGFRGVVSGSKKVRSNLEGGESLKTKCELGRRKKTRSWGLISKKKKGTGQEGERGIVLG